MPTQRNVSAVLFRLGAIHLLLMAGDLKLEDDALRAKVFKVASRIPMTWIGFGSVDALPFDTEGFIREVRSLP
jgi:hypothetical protein